MASDPSQIKVRSFFTFQIENAEAIPETFDFCPFLDSDLPLEFSQNSISMLCAGSVVGSYLGPEEDAVLDFNVYLRDLTDAAASTLVDFLRFEGLHAGTAPISTDYAHPTVKLTVSWTDGVGTGSVTYDEYEPSVITMSLPDEGPAKISVKGFVRTGITKA